MTIRTLIFVSAFASGFGPVTGVPLYWWQLFTIIGLLLNKIKISYTLFALFAIVFLLTFLRFDLIGEQFMGSLYPLQSFESYIQFIIVVIVSLIIYQMRIEEINISFKILFWFIFFGCLELVLRDLNLNSILSPLHVNPKGATKLTPSFTGREHSYGALCALSLLSLATTKMLMHQGISRIIGLTCVLFFVFIIYSLKSKAGMIGLVLYFIILTFVLVPKKYFVFGVSIFLIVSGIVMYLGYLIFNEYFFQIINVASVSVKTRFATAITGLEIIKNYPFFGIGLGNFTLYFPKYVDEEFVDFEIATMMTKNYGGIDPANFLIGWVAETGLIFLLVISIFLFMRASFPMTSDISSNNNEVKFISLLIIFSLCSVIPALISLYSFVSPQPFIFLGLLLKLKKMKKGGFQHLPRSHE